MDHPGQRLPTVACAFLALAGVAAGCRGEPSPRVAIDLTRPGRYTLPVHFGHGVRTLLPCIAIADGRGRERAAAQPIEDATLRLRLVLADARGRAVYDHVFDRTAIVYADWHAPRTTLLLSVPQREIRAPAAGAYSVRLEVTAPSGHYGHHPTELIAAQPGK